MNSRCAQQLSDGLPIASMWFDTRGRAFDNEEDVSTLAHSQIA
jgi:hypothetical protein